MRIKRSSIALLASTLSVLALVHWLAPTSGATRPLRTDLTGPEAVTMGSAAWPRTVTDFDGYSVRIPSPVRRAVSQYWSIDDFVYTVLPPQTVVGVSESAYLERISNVYAHVQRHKPIVATDPERVLRAEPHLIVVSSSARADFTALVRSTEIPIYRLATMFTTLEQVASTIRLMGYLTGEESRAEKEYQRFLEAVAKARAAKPSNAPAPRILGFGGRYSYGARTLFHDIVTTLGGVNVGAEGGLDGYDSVSTEQILRWDPEWIVASGDPGKEQQVRERLLEDPAIALTQAAREGKILVYDQRIFLPMSPYTIRILETLARDLYGR